MPSRIIKFILLLLVAGVVCYLFYLNPNSVSVTYRQGKTWEAPLALILICTFFGGAAAVGIVAVILGIKGSIKVWRKDKWLKKLDSHRSVMLQGRDRLSVGNFEAANRIFQRIVEQNPENLVAWILLAETYEQNNEWNKSVEIVNRARLHHKGSLELLLKAARLNMKLGNFTAAYDNLSIILESHPNSKTALRLISVCAEQLGRFEEALKFLTDLVKQLPSEQQSAELEKTAELRFKLAQVQLSGDEKKYKDALENISRKHKEFAPVLGELALLERNAQKHANASKYFSRAYNISADTRYLQEVASLWLEKEEPQTALSNVKSAVLSFEQSSNEPNIEGHLFLCSLLLHLEMIDEAAEELKGLEGKETSLEHNNLELPLRVLKSKVLERQGKAKEAAEIVYALVNSERVMLDLPTADKSLPYFGSEQKTISSNGPQAAL